MTRILSTAAVIALLAVPIACGGDDDSAASGDDAGYAVTIEILEEQGGGPFTATGDAVDQGIVCATGESLITGFVDQENGLAPSASTVTLLVDQEFTCDDGSGIFTLQETQDMSDPARIDEAIETGEVFGPPEDWTVISGTGDYEGLQGSGTYIGQATEPGSDTIANTFTGVLSSG